MNPYQLNEVVIEVFKESEMSQLEFSKKIQLELFHFESYFE